MKLKILGIMVLLSFLLVACLPKEKVPSYSLIEILSTVQITYATGDSREHVTQDIILPTEIPNAPEILVTWTSSDEDVIALDGTVTRYDQKVPVSLTLTLSYLEDSIQTVFSLTVIEKEIPVIEYAVTVYLQAIDDGYVETETLYFEGLVGTGFDYPEYEHFEIVYVLSDQPILTEANDQVFKVYYDRTVYAVVFFDGDEEIGYANIKYQALLEQPEDLVKEGYHFVGWSTSNTTYLEYNFDLPIEENLNLYAIFEDETVDPDPTYDGYYAAINGLSGGGLKNELMSILTNTMTHISYDSARQILAISDRNPSNHSQIVLVYDRRIVSGSWDGGSTWNREHVWPQSKLGHASVSDIHNLKPSTPSVNSSRGNLNFVDRLGGGAYGRVNGGWYPGAQDRGDIARIILYMHVRWNLSIDLVSNLNLILRWHVIDPVDDFEMHRNDVLFQYQKNRNPFIDHPELAESIWGPIDIYAPFFDGYNLNDEKIIIDVYIIDFQSSKKDKQFQI